MIRIHYVRNMAFALSAAALLAATPASAVLHDSLKCFKAKDTASMTAKFDILPPLDAPVSSDSGCTVKVRSRQICFAVGSDLVDASAPTIVLDGQELSNPFFCYAVKCPTEELPAEVLMSDMFGTRTLTGLRTSTLCIPAVFGVPPTTTTTLPPGTPRNCVDAMPPFCDGTCNSNDNYCGPDAGGTACICIYADQFGGCPNLGGGAPNCYGVCAGQQTCLEVSGACQCGLAY